MSTVVQPEKVDAAAGTFASVWQRFEEALAMVPKADCDKPLKPVQVQCWAYLLQ